MTYRILRVIYDWPKPWDGLAPAPYYLTKNQIKLGNKVDVFCAKWPKAGGVEQLKGASVHAFMREPLDGTILITTAPLVFVYFLIWRLFNKVDIYHFHGHFPFYIYIYKLLFGWLDKTPLVVHFHNTTKGRMEAQKQSIVKDGFFQRFVNVPLMLLSDKISLKVANIATFVNKQLLQEAITYYKADKTKCYVVETGVPTEVFYPSKKEKTKSKEKTILYVGALSERKNIHLIIEALEFLPKNYNICLIGRGYESYINRLKEIASKLGVLHRVRFEGYIPNDQIPNYLRKSDLFAIPSSYEGLPKVVIESLSCNVPVVASGFDITSPIRGLTFLKEITSKSLAKTIEKVISEDKGVDVEYIHNFYSWRAKAEEFQRIYDKITSKLKKQ